MLSSIKTPMYSPWGPHFVSRPFPGAQGPGAMGILGPARSACVPGMCISNGAFTRLYRMPHGPQTDLPLASAGSDIIGWSRVLLSHTLDAARSY